MTDLAILSRLAERRDCFYLYDEAEILARIGRLTARFPQVRFLYSIKCNPNPRVLESVFRQGIGADAASLGEVEAAGRGGLHPADIYYSAPGKTDRDLAGALGRCHLIADSPGELQRIARLAESRGEKACVGVRVNPAFCPAASKFGIDEESLPDILGTLPERLAVTGLHVHLRSQLLDEAALAEYWSGVFALAERMSELRDLDYVNLGSGIGVAYSPEDRPLDLDRLSARFADRYASFRARCPKTQVLIETGRFLLCESGTYVTTVIDRKTSRGRTYLILKNTLNGFLRPALARHFDAPAEPLFTCADEVRLHPLRTDGEPETVTLAGNLCTGADIIAENVRLPRLMPGDAIAITHAGSYAAALSPMQFSSQEPPAELFRRADGSICCP